MKIPIQIGSLSSRGMSSKDPDGSHNKPDNKEAIQGHFNVIHNPTKPAGK